MNKVKAAEKIGTGFMSLVDMFKVGGKDEFLDASKITDWASPAVAKADATKGDWRTPKVYSQEEGLDVLKMVYPYNDFSQIKLGDTVQDVPLMSKDWRTENIVRRGGHPGKLPQANFMSILEDVRLGNKTQVQAAIELGMADPRSTRKGFKEGKTFERLWKSFIEKNPYPDEFKTNLLSTKRKTYKEITLPDGQKKIVAEPQTIGPMVQRRALDLMKASEKGDPTDPFEVRVYNAWREQQGIPLGVGKREAGKEGDWNTIAGAIQSYTGKPFKVTPGKYDIYTGHYKPDSALLSPLKAYTQATDGDILTYTARTWAREKDLGHQRRVLDKAVKEDPAAEASLNWMKKEDPMSHYYEVDHIQPAMFGGTSDPKNLKAILKGSHSGRQLEPHMTATGEVSSFKSAFEKRAYPMYTKIIDIFDLKNNKFNKLSMNEKKALAAKTAKEIEVLANNFKKDNPDIDFIIGDPWVYVKNSKVEKGFDKMTYAEKILPKELQKIVNKYIVRYENLPNKNLSLSDSIKKVQEQLLPFFEDFGKLPSKKDKVPGIPKGEVIGKWLGEEGGLVRPHMALGGDMAQFTEMESVVPDLNPAEAGMEDYTQLAMSIPKFKNPFKIKPKPDIISDVSDTLKITDETKKGTKVEGTVKMEGQTPIFHLKSDLELANSPLDKMNAQQWSGYLAKRGVSQTELHEFGLGNLLKNLGGWDEGTKTWKNNKSITKADLIAAYKNNKPVITYKIQQMEPFEKGWKDFQSFLMGQKSGRFSHSELPASAREFEEMRNLKNKPQDLIGDRLRSSIVKFSQEISDRTGRDIKAAWPELEPQITTAINRIIKDAYDIENVMENGFGNVKVPFYTQNLVNRFSRLKKGEGFYMGKKGVAHEGSQFLEGGTGYIEIPFTYNPNPKGMRANEPRFKFGEGHFTNPEGNNPVFWLRASERVDESGSRTFLIEEIQSDMHQKVKQKPDTFRYAKRHDDPGFSSPGGWDEVEKLKDDLVKVSDQIDKITGHTDPSAVTVMERLKVKREALRKEIKTKTKKIEDAYEVQSDELFPEGPWKKSENQVKVAIKTLVNIATQEGFDNVAIITGKAKNHAVSASADIAKGNRGFYDGIAPSAMKNVAKNLGLEFSSTNIKDGQGNTWAKIPIIVLKKEPVTTSVDMYKAEGGFIYRPSFVDVVPVL